MSHVVRFSLPDDVFALLDAQAKARCKTRSEYARDATVAYITNHPAKGVVAQIVAERDSDRSSYGLSDDIPASPGERNQ